MSGMWHNRLGHGPYTTKMLARGPDRILSKNARIGLRHRVVQMNALRRWHERYQSVHSTRLSRHFVSDMSSESWKKPCDRRFDSKRKRYIICEHLTHSFLL